MARLFANNAFSTLAGAITAAATTMSVQAGAGAKFPTPTGGDYFNLTLFQMTNGVESNYEIVKVTARSVDTLTIVRAQEGTTARAYGVGDQVSLRGTAGTMTEFAQLSAAGQSFAQPVGVPTATAGDSSTQAANTLFVGAAISSAFSSTSTTVPALAAGTSSNRMAPASFVVSEKEYLTAIAAAAHTGSVVDVFLYDTSKDSDGGAWRKRCKTTSWENEALVPGRWLGYYPSTPAVAAAGAQVGDYYQHVDGFFYQITQVTPSIGLLPVTRGATREFPAVALIVLETARVIIYDATQPSLPMWMVFATANSTYPSMTAAGRSVGVSRTAAVAANGEVWVGAAQGAECILRISFIDERVTSQSASGYTYVWPGTLAQRNQQLNVQVPIAGMPYIVNATVNDLSIVVLPDAPINLSTGLPTPTVAVATQGGLSVLKHDGTIVNSSMTLAITNIALTRDTLYWSISAGSNFYYASLPLAASFVNDFMMVHSGTPAFNYAINHKPAPMPQRGQVAVGNANGAYMWRMNPTTPAKSMYAYINATFNTGWLVGDLRGAYLTDTVAETLTGTELVTNGTFDTDNSGWTTSGGGTNVVSGGALTITNPGSSGTSQYQYRTIATVPGRSYLLSADVTGTSYVSAGTTPGSTNLGASFNTVAAKAVCQFTATGATTYISIGVNTSNASIAATFDNVSCRLADTDRSMKTLGLAVFGSVTKAAVASGAQLIGYSGFSTTNYLEQAYSANMDFGTGDFYVMGWAQVASGTAYLMTTESGASGSSSYALRISKEGSSLFAGIFPHSTGSLPSTRLVTNYSGELVQFAVVRQAGVGYLYINGVQVNSAAGWTSSIGSGAVRVGEGRTSSFPLNSGFVSMLRMGATAPSADQIAQMYRDERAMFAPGAQVTLDGGNSAATAIAYDDLTDTVHVGTSWGRTSLRGLVRYDSLATTVGATTSISAASGMVITAGASGARYTQPTMTLRDEMRRQFEARRAMQAEEIPMDFDGIAAQTSFTLPLGFRTKGVFVAGAKKRAGSTKDYTVGFDGYRETVVFGAAPGAVWVQITANRG